MFTRCPELGEQDGEAHKALPSWGVLSGEEPLCKVVDTATYLRTVKDRYRVT